MTDKHEKPENTVSENVLQRIADERISMHSKYYFVAKSGLWILGTIVLFGLTLYLLSFIEFVYRTNGLSSLPSLGSKGWLVLLTSLPWLLIVGMLGIFVILQVLSTRFSLVYKRPLVHTTLASVVILVAGTTLIAHSTLHEQVLRVSHDRGLPIAGPLYRSYTADRSDRHIGVVTKVDEMLYTVTSRTGDIYVVKVATSTRVPRSAAAIATGTPIIVIGELDDDVIEAHGIRPLDRQPVMFPPCHERKIGCH